MSKGFKKFETGGLKHEGGKIRTDLLPPEAIESIAEGLTYGASKYADRNWEKGLPYQTIIGSILRHLLSIMHGDDIDNESGLPHHVHLITNAAFLTTFAKRGRKDLDDRPDKKFDSDDVSKKISELRGHQASEYTFPEFPSLRC